MVAVVTSAALLSLISSEASSLTRPPCIFDDGEIGNEAIKKKKAFSDVGDSETILKERRVHPHNPCKKINRFLTW